MINLELTLVVWIFIVAIFIFTIIGIVTTIVILSVVFNNSIIPKRSTKLEGMFESHCEGNMEY